MTSPPPNPSGTPPYRPAPYLVSGPGAFLTSEDLIRYFEDFYASLEYINTAPQMVFERLIGNLSLPVHAAIAKARRASASEAPGAGITCLQVPAAVLPPTVLPPVLPTPAVLPPSNTEQEVCGTAQHVIRSFSVDDCAEWNDTNALACSKAFPTAGAADLSRFAIALTSFHMLNRSELIASARITTPQDTGFSVTLSNSSERGQSCRLGSASCSWLQFGDYAPDIQCGVWSLDKSDGSNLAHKSANIIFPMRYGERPQVLVWLKGLHMSSLQAHSLRLEGGGINDRGFTLLATNSSVHGVEISWFACASGKPGMTIGTFYAGTRSGGNSNDGFDDHSSWTRREGYVAFPSGWFKVPPRVVVGITGFQIDKIGYVCLSVQVVQVTSDGMKWRIDGGTNGHIKYASGSFIAFE